ncbi:MAG: hypothetical protein DMF92_21970 [Acidobacteria bacterium]|nr:MAG: hypothetical protein DMF92_21970 [Acidobacteriota bacterium]
MQRFLRHVLAFLCVPGLLLLAAEAVLQGSGEVWPLDRVFAYQRAYPDSLYLRGTDQAFYAYKYRGIVEKKRSILAAGSSRMMKFRAAMFGDRGGAFYNAGGMLNSLRDVRDFCRLLPASRTPDVLLLGVDAWWLNESVPPVFSFEEEISKGAGFSFDEHILGIRWLLKHPQTFANEAISLVRGPHTLAIGISAREKGGGFRPDGSFNSPLETPRSEAEWAFVDRESPPIIERVKGAFANFPPASRVSPDRLALLDEALASYETKRVLVIGYLPPFSSEVVAHLRSDPRHSRFWSDFRRQMPELFRKHGFPVLDASETASLGMDDRAMSDGIHAEETFQIHVLKALLHDDRVRAALPGAEAILDRALASPATNYWNPDLGP